MECGSSAAALRSRETGKKPTRVVRSRKRWRQPPHSKSVIAPFPDPSRASGGKNAPRRCGAVAGAHPLGGRCLLSEDLDVGPVCPAHTARFVAAIGAGVGLRLTEVQRLDRRHGLEGVGRDRARPDDLGHVARSATGEVLPAADGEDPVVLIGLRRARHGAVRLGVAQVTPGNGPYHVGMKGVLPGFGCSARNAERPWRSLQGGIEASAGVPRGSG